MTILEQLESQKREIQERIEQRKAEEQHMREIEWEIVVLLSAEAFDTEPALVIGRDLHRRSADARGVAMAIICKVCRAHAEAVAEFFGCGRTNVLSRIKSTEDKCTDAKFKAKVERIETILQSTAAKRQGGTGDKAVANDSR